MLQTQSDVASTCSVYGGAPRLLLLLLLLLLMAVGLFCSRLSASGAGTMSTAKQLWAFAIGNDEKDAVTGVRLCSMLGSFVTRVACCSLPVLTPPWHQLFADALQLQFCVGRRAQRSTAQHSTISLRLMSWQISQRSWGFELLSVQTAGADAAQRGRGAGWAELLCAGVLKSVFFFGAGS